MLKVESCAKTHLPEMSNNESWKGRLKAVDTHTFPASCLFFYSVSILPMVDAKNS